MGEKCLHFMKTKDSLSKMAVVTNHTPQKEPGSYLRSKPPACWGGMKDANEMKLINTSS